MLWKKIGFVVIFVVFVGLAFASFSDYEWNTAYISPRITFPVAGTETSSWLSGDKVNYFINFTSSGPISAFSPVSVDALVVPVSGSLIRSAGNTTLELVYNGSLPNPPSFSGHAPLIGKIIVSETSEGYKGGGSIMFDESGCISMIVKQAVSSVIQESDFAGIGSCVVTVEPAGVAQQTRIGDITLALTFAVLALTVVQVYPIIAGNGRKR